MYTYTHDESNRKPQSELDTQIWYSPGHPTRADLPPAPAQHLQDLWRARAAGGVGDGGRKRGESYSVVDLYELLKRNPALQTEDDVLGYATTGGGQGNRALLKFVLSRKDLGELIERVARADGAGAAAVRQQMTRLDILAEAATQAPCTCETPGKWMAAANEVMQLNGYMEQELQRAVFQALHLGRYKLRNVILVGDTNRAKSFLVKPLLLVYNCFVPPDTGSHQLADIDGSEVVFLNEFDWDPALMPWRTLKDFLEGSEVKIAVPKTQSRAKNYMFKADTPIIGTAPGPIEHPKSQKETEQMDTRVRYFALTHWFDPKTCPEIKPCKACFAKWIHGVRHLPPPPPPESLPREWYGRDREVRRACRRSSTGQAQGERWFFVKEAGTYSYSDLPGRCFKCGREGHLANQCDTF